MGILKAVNHPLPPSSADMMKSKSNTQATSFLIGEILYPKDHSKMNDQFRIRDYREFVDDCRRILYFLDQRKEEEQQTHAGEL